MCYVLTLNSGTNRNLYPLCDVDFKKHSHRGVIILFGHWWKQNTHGYYMGKHIYSIAKVNMFFGDLANI